MLAVFGPGLIVMLADTDAGSVITAAQSGAQWGYRLLVLQLALIPVLFIVQELTVRLGLVTKRGHGELIRDTFGRGWAWLSVGTLGVACVGALLTQLSGIADIARMFGWPVGSTIALVIVSVLAMVLTGSYRSVERIAIAFGTLELAFVIVAWRMAPDAQSMRDQFLAAPWRNPELRYLAAANVGAVIMPWMVFYQQSAVVDKGLDVSHLRDARIDTAIGAVLTQAIMAAIIIALAAAAQRSPIVGPLAGVGPIADALNTALGARASRVVVAAGLTGAALVATVVVCLTAAWGFGEVAGYSRSLEHHPREAPWFYGVFAVTLVAGGAVVVSGIDLVRLSLAVQVMNTLLLPIVLGFLLLLGRRALPAAHRLRGGYALLAGGLIAATCAFGLWSAALGTPT